MKNKLLGIKYKSLLPLILLLLLAITTSSQSNALDSLFVDYQQSTVDTSKIILLNKIAYQFHRVDIDSTAHYSNIALALATKRDYKKGKARSLNLLGIVATFKGEYTKALDLNAKSYELAQELKSNHLISLSSNGLCVTYDQLNNIELSIYYGQIALEAAKQLKDTVTISYILTNLCEFHFNAENYTQSSNYNDEVLGLARMSEDCRLLSIGFHYQGKLQFAAKDMNGAMKSLTESLSHAEICNDEYIASLNYFWISKIYFFNKNYSSAKDYIDRSNKILNKIGGRELHLENYLLESDILLKLNKQSAAVAVLNEGLSKSKNGNQLHHEINYLKRLGSIYKNRSDFKKAFTYGEESKVLQDSLNNLNKAVSMLQLERKYNLEKKDVEVQLLKEQKIKDAQIIRSRSYQILASTLFTLLIGVIAFFTWLNLRKEAKHSTQLETKVTERTKELQQSNEMLHSSNQELERFAYISSHDLKEPLKNMISFTKLIKNESVKLNLPKISEYSNILENCSNQLNTLVSDILDYSLVKSDLKIQDVDLNLIVEQLQSDLKDTIKSKNAIISADKLPVIKSDKSKMYQAFKNIVENGIKYNKSATPRVTISTEGSNGSWKIKFADNGIGIDPKYQEDIFMMFKRLHNKEEYPGSGIGLSAVKTIINKLSGKVTVSSDRDQGSEFTITIPKVLT